MSGLGSSCEGLRRGSLSILSASVLNAMLAIVIERCGRQLMSIVHKERPSALIEYNRWGVFLDANDGGESPRFPLSQNQRKRCR